MAGDQTEPEEVGLGDSGDGLRRLAESATAVREAARDIGHGARVAAAAPRWRLQAVEQTLDAMRDVVQRTNAMGPLSRLRQFDMTVEPAGGVDPRPEVMDDRDGSRNDPLPVVHSAKNSGFHLYRNPTEVLIAAFAPDRRVVFDADVNPMGHRGMAVAAGDGGHAVARQNLRQHPPHIVLVTPTQLTERKLKLDSEAAGSIEVGAEHGVVS